MLSKQKLKLQMHKRRASKLRGLAWLGMALSLLVLCFPAVLPINHLKAAGTIDVNSTDDTDVYDGVCTLREAITAAITDTNVGAGECEAGDGDDTINIPAGTYTLTSDLPRYEDDNGSFQGISFIGAGSGTTIIDGVDEYQGIRIYTVGHNASITGITQRRSTNPISIEGTDCSMNDVIQTEGSGLTQFHCSGDVALDHVQQINFSDGFDAGMELNGEDGSTLTVNDLKLANNVPNPNGDNATLTFTGFDTANANNIEISDSGCDDNCYFGGLLLGGDTGEQYSLRNVTISGNTGYIGGAFVQSNSADVKFENVTIANNVALNSGEFQSAGLMYFEMGSGNFTNQNTLLEDNKTESGINQNCFIGTIDGFGTSSTPGSLGSNLSSDSTCTTAFDQTGDINDESAQLAPLADNGGYVKTHAIEGISPVVDKGATIIGMSADARGVNRPQCESFDIGSYEYDGNECPVLGSSDGDGDNSGGSEDSGKSAVSTKKIKHLGVPDTGFGILLNNPIQVAAATSACACGIFLVSRRFA